MISATVGALAAVSFGQPAKAGPWDGVTGWETATVSRIVDGDTLIVTDEVTGASSRIRLLGVNAPEIDTAQHGGRCGGWQAKDVLKELLPVGTRVRLASADRSSTGKNARPQRVVLGWNPQTGQFDFDVAWAMAERGWGLWFTVPREAAMSSLYRQVIAGAQQRKDGMWNPALCGTLEQPEANVQIRIARAVRGSAPNDEWVMVRNAGSAPINLSGWLLRDSGNQGWFTFPDGSVLNPGDYRVVHTGNGTAGMPDAHDLYANYPRQMYQPTGTGPNLVGDGAYLLDRFGNFRSWREYPCLGPCAAAPPIGIQDLSLGRKKGAKRAATQWVRLVNQGPSVVCLDGYRISTGSQDYRLPPNTCLDPGATWTLHIGTGVADAANAYWGLSQPALWTHGSVTVIDDLEAVVASRRW